MAATRNLSLSLSTLFLCYFFQLYSINLHGEHSKVGLHSLDAVLTASQRYVSAFRQEAIITFGGLFKITLTKNSFFRTRRSISNWTKHGQTSLLIAGLDPPVDITIYLDVSQNPGPDSVALNHYHIILVHLFLRIRTR